jgi:ATP-binding cassette subfamily F protein uup
MSALLGIHSLAKSYGTQTLFKAISFTLVQGDRVGLIGPNGSGKSTLLKILMGLEKEDSGSISRRQGLRVGYCSQVPEFPSLPLEQVLTEAVPELDEIEALTRARILLSKAQFADETQNAQLLSGGWKKRLDLVRALMQEPDLLLLDEPTNHLDLEGILWLEKFLSRERIAYLVISHDRYFLENVCNKVIELNPCYPEGLFVSDGNMSNFLEHKEAFLKAQEQQARGMASVMRDELAWLRTSPKARTTKSRSRIQRAYELMEDLGEIQKRNLVTKVDLEFSASERQTRKLLTGTNLSKSLGGKLLFKGVDLKLSPGTRLGIVGKNGTGKTTLLKVLAGMLPQDTGTIKYADDLKLVYFDQHREQVPPHIPLREAISPTGDFVTYQGKTIHVHGWAKRFLFSPDRLDLPVRCLSGGERARIQIAKLMLEPADILFLDEPTNDLDIPTLEVIEASLLEFTGAVVLISHDRCLMDRICTEILGLGNNNEGQIYADYAQWERACKEPSVKKEATPTSEIPSAAPAKPKKLSYKEQKELEAMEKNILAAEDELEALQQKLDDPQIHADSQKAQEHYRLLSLAQKKHEELFARWEELDKKSRGQ